MPTVPSHARITSESNETVHEKPAFAHAFTNTRCIIPANGWFEWTGPRGAKTPYWIRLQSTNVFALAGIWSRCENGGDPVDTFAVLTTDAAPAIGHLHHRQPVILDEAGVDVWLDPEETQDNLRATIQQPAQAAFESWPVTREVNDLRQDGAWLIDGIAA